MRDSARLHVAHASGETFVEEGPATGTLPGTVRISLTLGTNTVHSGFTIYLRNGTITGHSYAKLNPGRSEYASFAGSLAVSHGTGHYAHASGTGTLYGAINRNTDNATVQVIGNLHL